VWARVSTVSVQTLEPVFQAYGSTAMRHLALACRIVFIAASHVSANNFSHITVLFQGTLEMFGGIGLMIGPPIGGALFEVLLIYM